MWSAIADLWAKKPKRLPTVLLDGLGDQNGVFAESAMGCVFIFSRESAITGDVGIEDGSKLARGSCSPIGAHQAVGRARRYVIA